MVIFGLSVIFLGIPFCVTNFCTKTYDPLFRFVAGVSCDFFRIDHSVFVIVFWQFFGNFYFFSLFKIYSVYVPEDNFKVCGC